MKRLLLLFLLLAAAAPLFAQLQQVNKPAGGLPQVGPLPDFNFLGSTGTVGRSTRLINASNALETLAAQPNWSLHAGAGAGVFTTPTNGIAMSTNANVVTVGANLAASAPLTLTTNASGQITVGAAGVGSGTVTSVGLAVPGGLSVLDSPVTSAGSISILAAPALGFWFDNGAGVTSWSINGGGLTNLTGSNIVNGPIPDSVLNSDVTRQGNVFNGASELLQLNSSDQIPSLDGSLLFNLNASAFSSGTVPAARLPAFSGDITTSAGSTVTTLKNTGTAGTYTKPTFDAQGREISGTTLSAGDIPALPESGITGLPVDLAQRVLTNDTRNLVLAGSTNFLGTDAAATRLWGDGSRLALSSITVWASFAISNAVFGDFFFFDATNHAWGFTQTNGNQIVWTNGVLSTTGTNTEWLDNLEAAGWATFNGAFTNPTIVNGIVVADNNGKQSAATVGSGLNLAAGVLTATGSQTPLLQDVNGALFGITNLSKLTVGTNANSGLLVIDGNGNITLYSINGSVFQAYDQNTNAFFQLFGTNRQIAVRGLIQFPTNGLPIGWTVDPGAGNLNASNTVSALGITNRQFAAVGVVTNDANGKEYTTPTLQNALLANSTIGVGGTANQITSSSATPALGGSTTLALANPMIAPGPISASQVTNSGFSAIGVVTNDANGKLYTTPTLPSTLLGSGQAVYGGNTYTNEVISQTFFQAPNSSGGAAISDTTGITRCVLPAAGTLCNLYVIASGNPGSVANTVTVMTNGVTTGITVTLNNVTSANDTTHLVAVLAGTEVGIKIVTGAGTAVKWGWGFQLK